MWNQKPPKKSFTRDDNEITKAEKGGAVVIIDYIREAESQLKDKDSYDRLKYDPTETRNRLVNNTIRRCWKEKVAEWLKKKPQEHQNSLYNQKHIKEETVVPQLSVQVNCYNSNISKYVGYHLQPIVKEIPFYVKDKRFYSKIQPNRRSTRRQSTCHMKM